MTGLNHFIEWVQDNNVKPIACEKIIADNRIKIAGSVDFIGHDAEGQLFLADYKCRTNTKGKAKVYDKDCQQLAIESWMLSRNTS
jgi:RecB family exonuclease